MFRIAMRPYPRMNSCQWGRAFITICATTGVPMWPSFSNVFRARIDWSYRMFWLTPSFLPAASQTRTISLASARVAASGFWARIPFT